MERDRVFRVAGLNPLDLALALALLLLQLAIQPWSLFIQMYPLSEISIGVAVLSLTLQFGALLLRRTFPELAIILICAALIANHLAPYGVASDLDHLVTALVFYGVGAYGQRCAQYEAGVALLVIIASLAIYWRGFIQSDPAPFLADVVLVCVLSAIAYFLGALRARGFVRLRQLDAEAEAALAQAEQREQIATLAERQRIAREMHDVVAHTLSIVIAQADGGRYAAKKDPQAAVNSLRTISEMSRSALADIRAIIGILRDGEETAPLTPLLEDGQIEKIVKSVEESGREVVFTTHGAPPVLPMGASGALVKICQESVTNILKHGAPDAKITIALKYVPGEIALTVENDGGSAGHGHARPKDMRDHRDAIDRGHGIIGMRERAEAFGGQVDVGPHGDGWRVCARIPVPKR